MKILVLNPNTSSLVTDKVRQAILPIVKEGVEVVVAQIKEGPEVLESYYDESMAMPFVIEAIKDANKDGFDAVILAAFCDPGIEALKEVSDIPVYGIEECAFSLALLYGNKFGILTEKKHKEAVKTQHVRKAGLLERFAGVKALGMGVVEIAEDENAVFNRGVEVVKTLIDDCGAEVIIMGCASMAGYSDKLSEELGVPVIDPVSSTYKMVEGLTELKMKHSKIGLFAKPVVQKWHK